jgi:hypothetical protein
VRERKLADKNIPVKNALIIAGINGIAFGAIRVVYSLIQGDLGSFLWCVYAGFLLTVALGLDIKKGPNLVCSLTIGYGWAFLYWESGTWIKKVFLISATMSNAIADTLVTFGLLFLHMAFLKKTWANIIPVIFLTVMTVFATSGLTKILYCALSIIIGMIMALGIAVITQKMVQK